MSQSVRTLPVYRRLFLAFACATALSVVGIAVLGTVVLQGINAQRQNLQVSVASEQEGISQEVNLQRMNALLQARFAQEFASSSIEDASLTASIHLTTADILQRAADFEQSLKTYQRQYQLASALGMSSIRSLLHNESLVARQHDLLTNVALQWQRYKQEQEPLLLNRHTLYTQAYATLFQANTTFTELRSQWQQIEYVAQAITQTITTLGPVPLQPLLVDIGIVLFLLIVLISVIGVLISQTITRPLQQMVLVAQQVSLGDIGIRIPVYGTDEFALLATAINRILEKTLVPMPTTTHADDVQGRIAELIRILTPMKRESVNIHHLSALQDTDDAVGNLTKIVAHLLDRSSQTILYAYSAAQKSRVGATRIDAQVRQVHLHTQAQRGQTALIVSEEEDVLSSLLNVVDRLGLWVNALNGQRQDSNTREATQMNEQIEETLAHMQAITQQVQSHGQQIHALSEAVRLIGVTVSHIIRHSLDLTIQVALTQQQESPIGMLAMQLKQSAEGAKNQVNTLSHDLRLHLEAFSTLPIDVERVREGILTTAIHAQATQTWLEGNLDRDRQTKMLIEVKQELERLIATSRPIADHLLLLQEMLFDQQSEGEVERQAQYLIQLANHVLNAAQPFVPHAKGTTVLTARTFSYAQ